MTAKRSQAAELLLGLDIGTTGLRGAVFDGSGALVADASLTQAHVARHVGWAETNAESWWTATRTIVGELQKTVDLESIAGICVTGQAPTAVLVDDAGAPTRPALLWLDTRAQREAEQLGVHAYYLGPKLSWLARNEPEALAKARWLLQSHAFLAMRLTGEVATDPSTAALCLPLFDTAALEWSPEACAAVGVRPEQLPPIRRAQDRLGAVTQDAATATGLRRGTPVMVGGGDFAAATLGAGVLDEGEACLMLGTAGNLLVPRRTPGRDPRLIHAHHVGTDRWLSLGGTLSGGAQEWLRYAMSRGTGDDEADTSVRSALPTFDVLEAEASRVATGSEGLLFLPYLQGERTPIWDVDARGAFVGLGLRHGRGHLWRALLEGIALGFVDCQQVLEDDGVRLREVVAANGGGKSALFRQILCDALGVPLKYASNAGGTVAGAAILAGLGTGVITSVEDVRAWRAADVRHEPDLAAHGRYRELLGLRRAAYTGLKPVFSGLAAYR